MAMTMNTTAVPPGWHPDPSNPGGALRWWDGSAWTAHTHPVVASVAAACRKPAACRERPTGRERPAGRDSASCRARSRDRSSSRCSSCRGARRQRDDHAEPGCVGARETLPADEVALAIFAVASAFAAVR